MPPPRRICLIAGEPSGDRLGADIARALHQRWPDATLTGLAGPAMRAAGVQAFARTESVSVMGIVEVLARLPQVLAVRRKARQALADDVDLAVFIDAPDLNLPLARAARRAGIATVGVGSPQVWAWRKGRILRIVDAYSSLLCFFAMEPPLYLRAAAIRGSTVQFVGHPGLDDLPARGTVDPHHYAICPGSRAQEFRRHVGPFQRTTDAIRAADPAAHFTWVVPEASRSVLPAGVRACTKLDEVGDARAALTKSGTITLQLAARGIPMVVAHRVHPITWALARLLVHGVRHIALPNIIDPTHPVPEHIQHLDPEVLARAVIALPHHQAVDLGGATGPSSIRHMTDAIEATWARHSLKQ